MANVPQFNGWISLHRKFLSWEFFDDSDAVKLFVYMLLKVAPNEFVYNGKTIGIGQFITSFRELEKETKISYQKLRTILNKFQERQIIEIQSNNHYSVIEVLNYKNYQRTRKKTDKILQNQNNTQINTQSNTQSNTPQTQIEKDSQVISNTQINTQSNTQNNTRIDNNINKEINNKYLLNQSVEKNEFLNLCCDFSELYSQIMINEFVEYWTQETENGISKYEAYIKQNQSFDIKQRLFYWNRKAKKIAESKTTNKAGRQNITPEMAAAAQYALNR